MNKLEHLKACKQFLRKVVNYRRNLMRLRVGKPATENMVKTIASIGYNVNHPAMDNFDRMHNWIAQKGVQSNIIELIPANKIKWKVELQQLVNTGDFLQGRCLTKINQKTNQKFVTL